MQKFVYEYATKVYFGEGAAKEHLAAAVSAYGPHVMLAYGGGSVKKNGIYDEVKSILEGAGKEVTDFSGIMSNPTYAKCRKERSLQRRNTLTLSLQWAAALSWTVPRLWRWRQDAGATPGRITGREKASLILIPSPQA